MASFTAGTTFTDGVANDVTAAKLAALVNAATPTSGFIQDRTAETAIAADDTLLFGDFSDSSNLKRMTVANFAGTLPTATITSGTITNLASTTGTIATGVIPTLTSSTATFGTTTSTAATITSGTITNLASTTGTITNLASTTGTIATLIASAGTFSGSLVNVTTGTIGNLSTTLAGDFTISSGTGTLGTTGVTAGTYGNATAIPFLTVDAKGRITSATTGAFSTFPAGAVMSFAMNSAPSGWLGADGSAVNRTTYADLFTAISTTYGTGDGSTTFNLPDLRGIFVRGSGSQTISGITYNKTFAAKEGDALQGHWHQSVYTTNANVNSTFPTRTANTAASTIDNNSVRSPITDGTNGTPRTASETRPANIALLYCIKY